ncbi:hypothetical protein PORY_002587 [Pneumocystis oryctolagi]|uniref:Uncharacterized protein n=1 Tax=Pneumocystis oryctolagi TaxID=42067 RepID=A0ACB7CB74_9ASCO|nr:hypothetical protein PORY_002587 [Pneumocystis oryctolagi]
MRNLPEKNPLLGKPKKSVLLKQCKTYNIRFEDNVYIDFITLPVPIPSKDKPLYLVRMKYKHDYICATAMFRVAFPFATESDEFLEFDHYIIKQISSATSNEYTSGIWVMLDDALSLAEDYGIRPWIKVLINAPIEHASENTLSPSKKVTATAFKKHIQYSIETKPKYSTPTGSQHNEDTFSETLTQELHTKKSISPKKKAKSFKDGSSSSTSRISKNTVSSVSSTLDLNKSVISKKRPLELSGSNDFIPIKRFKIEKLEEEIVIERRRVKALFALVVSLGISVTLPYIL